MLLAGPSQGRGTAGRRRAGGTVQTRPGIGSCPLRFRCPGYLAGAAPAGRGNRLMATGILAVGLETAGHLLRLWPP
ncbi:hypothetical protein GCM10010499_29980 [Streptomyces thermoviolaceus subsp. apingens]|nr:hypothetical protein GCM10010499_29980 [Streptomyces thermoviolaceus subsp. apingens]